MSDFLSDVVNLFLERFDELIGEVKRIADAVDKFPEENS